MCYVQGLGCLAVGATCVCRFCRCAKHPAPAGPRNTHNQILATISRSYPYTHPFASLKGSDNIIAFTTKRYPNPLIVQGAGAGAQVTAAGIFSDILTIHDRVFH